MASTDSPWLIGYRRNPAPHFRIFCFHCAGGSASDFKNWPNHLPSEIELVAVQLPGREGRVREARLSNMDDLVHGVVNAISPFMDRPFAMFGHSFGAITAFEVIRGLRREGLTQPRLFFPAGRRGPNVTKRQPPIASLPDDLFVEELRKGYGDHFGLILANAGLREAFVPQIRADFGLSEGYLFRGGEPLDCPIVAFAGIDENNLDAHELNAWGLHTSRSFHSKRFPGDHYFVRTSRELVIATVVIELTAVLSEAVTWSY